MANHSSKIIVIDSVAFFLKVLDELAERGPAFYRGQSKNWPLLPGIGRLKHQIPSYENWQVFQKDIIDRFAKYARPLINPLPKDTEEWLLHAQHYGVPTRLLDWTTNPLKALFWAVENPKFWTVDKIDTLGSKNGVVWAFMPTHWRDDALDPTPLSDENLTTFFPKHFNLRIVAQESSFVSFPLPESTKPLRPIERNIQFEHEMGSLTKIIITSFFKRDLYLQLSHLGITHRSLFPDLHGISLQLQAELNDDLL